MSPAIIKEMSSRHHPPGRLDRQQCAIGHCLRQPGNLLPRKGIRTQGHKKLFFYTFVLTLDIFFKKKYSKKVVYIVKKQ